MKKIKTNITNRAIKFVEFDTEKNWISDFPNDNWCLILIANEKKTNYFEEIIRKSIDRNVGYICGVGKQADLIHNIADEEIVFRDIDIDDHFLPKHHIMTVRYEDFENGIWFGLNLTFNSETKINQIVIVDVTKKAFDKTTELINKFENGYLPAD
ncbi:hypothetical protein [Flavivirga eckloniae]|uniref:Uncharacterized protein n=1 Tax=Flavivirga eckloniae TaxID=1803846 RepID=A0A2K9PTK9_9FLAO|nr:hypothetical protein [Flavivirga eckloniae]AUP80395.1 hypothetical protein C1H87_17430 [Flavivirga eckloniae]